MFWWIDFLPSCLALNDLIRGRQADDLIDHLAEIWETLFRVLDDIKVSRKWSQSALLWFFRGNRWNPLIVLAHWKKIGYHVQYTWHTHSRITINTWQRDDDVCLDFVMCLLLCPFAFQESVRKAADLTLKTLSKVRLFVTILACVFIPVCLYMCTSKHPTVSFPLCPGVHSYVWVNRLCSSENCGGDVTNPAGKRHCQQCVRGPLTKVTANFEATYAACLSVKCKTYTANVESCWMFSAVCTATAKLSQILSNLRHSYIWPLR